MFDNNANPGIDNNLSWAFNFQSGPHSPAVGPTDNSLSLPIPPDLSQPPPASFTQPPSADPPSDEVHLNLRPATSGDGYSLAAADQQDGSRDERLARVIHAKFEAGLLKPYDYVSGYRRLMHWMDTHVCPFRLTNAYKLMFGQMSATSKQRTLKTLGEFRPTFRAIAASLTDLDLIFIEEAFERLLLDYGSFRFLNMKPVCS